MVGLILMKRGSWKNSVRPPNTRAKHAGDQRHRREAPLDDQADDQASDRAADERPGGG